MVGALRRGPRPTLRRSPCQVGEEEDVAGALAGIFTMGIAMNDDKVYLVVTQKDASV